MTQMLFDLTAEVPVELQIRAQPKPRSAMSPEERRAHRNELQNAWRLRTGKTKSPGLTRAERASLIAAWPTEDFFPVPRASACFPGRVFTRIDVTGSCWWWTGLLDGDGYGFINRGGMGQGNIQAYRAVWELLIGRIPEGLVFDHLCRNHACVHPGHGELVTDEVNILRGYSITALNAKRDLCDYGHPFDNTTTLKSGRVKRTCKTCTSRRSKARRERLAKQSQDSTSIVEVSAC
jgi:hypothetical protein